jgi:hypothetical protein
LQGEVLEHGDSLAGSAVGVPVRLEPGELTQRQGQIVRPFRSERRNRGVASEGASNSRSSRTARHWRAKAHAHSFAAPSVCASNACAAASAAVARLETLACRRQRGGGEREADSSCRNGVSAAGRTPTRLGTGFDRVRQNPEAVLDPVQPARVEDGRVDQREQTRLQGQQMTREVAAVHRRDIERGERLERRVSYQLKKWPR